MWTELRTVLQIRRAQRRLAHLDREQLEADKLRRFRRLVRQTIAKAPYYAQIVAERGIDIDRCSPTDFPVLTKSILMANFDRIVTDPRITRATIESFLSQSKNPNDLLLDEYRVLHTSGTSGEVGYFVYSRADWIRGLFAPARRRPRRLRRRRGGRLRTAFYGATDGHFAGVTIARSAEHPLGKLFMQLGTFEINRPLSETIADLNAFQPDFMFGYTTALKVLAKHQLSGELQLNLSGISAGGETVTAADMDLLARAFGCEVSSAYACTEHLMIGSAYRGEAAMTIYDDNLIIECNEDHSLFTNLFNRTLPLIRYRMSDVLQPLPNDGSSRHLQIKNIVGRTETAPTFMTSAGTEDFISPHTINEIFVAGVTRFQMVLTGPRAFTFRACLDATLDAHARRHAITELTQRLREILAQKRMEDVKFDIEVCAELPIDPRTRKFRLIVDERNAAAHPRLHAI